MNKSILLVVATLILFSLSANAYPIRCSGTDPHGVEVTLVSDGGAHRTGEVVSSKDSIDLISENYQLRLDIDSSSVNSEISGKVVHVKPRVVNLPGPHTFKLKWNMASRENPNATLTTKIKSVKTGKTSTAKYMLFCSVPMVRFHR